MTQYSIPLPVELAGRLQSEFKSFAASAALFIQQLHYWTCKQVGEEVDGRRWIYNSYEKWRFQMPWLSDYGFRKVRQMLIDAGIILVEQLGLREQGRDRSCWYALKYEHELIKDDPWFSMRLEVANPFTACMLTSPSVDCATNQTNTTSKNSQSLNKTTTAQKNEVVVLAEIETKEELTASLSQHSKDMAQTSQEEIGALQEGENFAAAVEVHRKLLSEIRHIGIPMSKNLQRLVQRSSVEVVENAIAAFKEQQDKGNVRVPAAFMIRAIECSFRPLQSVKKKQDLEEFNAWYKTRKDNPTTCSDPQVTGLPEGQIGVLLRGSNCWIYWREIDSFSAIDADGGGSGR